MKKLNKTFVIGFPDGHTKTVNYVRDTRINSVIELKNVVFVLDFKHSLLSVSKILNDSKLVAYFTTHGCFLGPYF